MYFYIFHVILKERLLKVHQGGDHVIDSYCNIHHNPGDIVLVYFVSYLI